MNFKQFTVERSDKEVVRSALKKLLPRKSELNKFVVRPFCLNGSYVENQTRYET